ncbi:unnamed protein product, partial [Prorocentrum cordatum]
QLTVQIADIESELRALRSRSAEFSVELKALAARVEVQAAARAGPQGGTTGAGVCKYGKACHRRDCVFDHPQGRTIDEGSEKAKASSASQPPSGQAGDGPMRINPRASPINYSKFENIVFEDAIDDLLGGTLGTDPTVILPPEPGVDAGLCRQINILDGWCFFFDLPVAVLGFIEPAFSSHTCCSSSSSWIFFSLRLLCRGLPPSLIHHAGWADCLPCH